VYFFGDATTERVLEFGKDGRNTTRREFDKIREALDLSKHDTNPKVCDFIIILF
jgi:hypothetical protein